MSIGLARLASPGSSSASCARVSDDTSESSRPAASHASEQRMPEAAGVGQDRDAPPARQRLRREQRGRVDQLFERLGAQHPGLVEERLDGLLRPGQRSRVRPGRPGAGLGRAALHRQDRLLACDAARDPAEAARIPERLEVEHDQSGALVLLPVLEEVVGRDVRLVADRDEGGEAEAALGCFLEERQAERSALRGEGDRPRRERARPERRVQRRPGDRDPEAVGADEAAAVCAHEREQLVLARAAFLSDLREARRDHADGANPSAKRGLRGLDHVRARQADHREVDDSGSSSIDVYALDACHRRALDVDRVGGALEVAARGCS